MAGSGISAPDATTTRRGPTAAGDGGGQAVQPLQAAYRQCAEQAFEIARQAGTTEYAHRQLLADGLAQAGRGLEALKLFEELSAQRGDDARNLQGMARCQWLLGRYTEAIELYRRLSEGLSPVEHPVLWWRVQLDMARCIRDGAAGRADVLERLAVRIRQLEAMDATFGGYRPAFEALRGQAGDKNGEDTKITKDTKNTKTTKR